MPRTVAYSEVIDRIEALAGVDSFNTDETSWVNSFINRRARDAYQRTLYWPDYLVVDEPRPVLNEGIPLVGSTTADYTDYEGDVWTDTPDYLAVTGTNDGYDGAYVRAEVFPNQYYSANTITPKLNGQLQTVLTFIKVAGESLADGDPIKVLYFYDTSGLFASDYAFLSDITPAAMNKPIVDSEDTESWGYWRRLVSSPKTFPTSDADMTRDFIRLITGVAPFRFSVIGDIDTIIRVTGGEAFGSDTTTTYDTVVEGDYIKVINGPSGQGAYYCTYQKRFTDTIGDGTGGTTATVPHDWADYIAHGALSDYLRSQGDTERAIIEDNFAKHLLDVEVQRVERASAANLTTRIRTHGNAGRKYNY